MEMRLRVEFIALYHYLHEHFREISINHSGFIINSTIIIVHGRINYDVRTITFAKQKYCILEGETILHLILPQHESFETRA